MERLHILQTSLVDYGDEGGQDLYHHHQGDDSKGNCGFVHGITPLSQADNGDSSKARAKGGNFHNWR